MALRRNCPTHSMVLSTAQQPTFYRRNPYFAHLQVNHTGQHISGCIQFRPVRHPLLCLCRIEKIYFEIARCVESGFTFARLCGREDIKSQQGLRLRRARLSRYPPTLKRSKDETVAQRRHHQASYRYAIISFSRGRSERRGAQWRRIQKGFLRFDRPEEMVPE